MIFFEGCLRAFADMNCHVPCTPKTVNYGMIKRISDDAYCTIRLAWPFFFLANTLCQLPIGEQSDPFDDNVPMFVLSDLRVDENIPYADISVDEVLAFVRVAVG